MRIGDDAFWNCSNLTSIQVDKNNSSYNSVDGVLYTKNNTELIRCPEGKKEIEILNGVTRIESGAFKCCSSLTGIVIPNSVTSIGLSAFECCSSLTSIVIPNGVTNIEAWAFQSCSSLTSIEIPDGVTSIGYGSFGNCNGIDHVLYSGTEDEWNSISIDENNKCLINATRHYEADSSAIGMLLEIKPTCDSDGKITYHCSICDSEFGIILRSVGHSYEAETVAPTCTSDGYTVYRCNQCGEEYYDSYVEAKGHNLVDGVCMRCGYDYLTEIYSGICGNNLTWTLDHKGTLTISGTGKMYNYVTIDQCFIKTPWWYYCDRITAIQIDNGVTSIGEGAFHNCSSLSI